MRSTLSTTATGTATTCRTRTEIGIKPLKGDGDFRSAECIELLKQADIVVTNPPFSLFREYVAHLIEHDKKFLIIGNQNAMTYKEIFPLIQDEQVVARASQQTGDMAFKVPDDYPPRGTRFWIDEEGQKWRSLGNIVLVHESGYREASRGAAPLQELRRSRVPVVRQL